MAAASKGAASLSPLKRAEAELTKLNDAIFGESASGAAAPAPGSDYEGQRHRAAAAAAPLTTKGAVSAREILAAGGSRSARASPAGPSPQGRGRGRSNKGAAGRSDLAHEGVAPKAATAERLEALLARAGSALEVFEAVDNDSVTAELLWSARELGPEEVSSVRPPDEGPA